MKKGLTITLLMVALVALAASASAIAPTINTLPAVVIGDAGDVSGAGTTALHLLRYENVFNLASTGAKGMIDRTLSASGGTSTSLLAVYYTVPSPATNTLKASNATTKVQPMTAAEITSLLGGAAPAGKKINTASDFWLSLVHDAGTTPTISAKAATPAVNGATTAVLTAKSSLNPTVVTLYATDATVLSGDQVATGSFVVYSIIGAEDAWSPVTGVYDSAGKLPGTGHDGWVFDSYAAKQVGALANIQPGTELDAATGIGFTGLASFNSGKNQGWSGWNNAGNALSIGHVVGMDPNKQIFRAKLSLTGNGASASAAPGYRVLWSALGFGQVGGYAVNNNAGVESNTPSANLVAFTGNPVNPRAYWGCPKSLNQYGDGEKLATVAVTIDLRDYFLYFDVLQTKAGQTGTLVLENAVIEKITRPFATTPYVAWGGTDRAFNGAGALWQASGNDGGTGWGIGSATVSAASVVLSMGSGSSAFEQISVQPINTTTCVPWASNQLLRFSYTVAASDSNTAPKIRILGLPWRTDFSNVGSLTYGDSYDPGPIYGWYTSSAAGLGAVPKTAGSSIEMYAWTQNAPTVAAEACIIAPLLDIDVGPTPAFPQNGWQIPRASVTVSAASIEVCTSN